MAHRVQILAIIPYGSMTVPIFLDESSKNIPFLLKYKKEKGKLIIRISKGRWFH